MKLYLLTKYNQYLTFSQHKVIFLTKIINEKLSIYAVISFDCFIELFMPNQLVIVRSPISRPALPY